MNNYSFNVFWSEEDEAYIATCPEFPRISAFGDTAEQALAEMQVALEMAIETYQEEGWPLPRPRTQPEYSGQFRVRMPKSLHARLASQAEDEGVSLNTLVITYLSEAVGENTVRTYRASATHREDAIAVMSQMRDMIEEISVKRRPARERHQARGQRSTSARWLENLGNLETNIRRLTMGTQETRVQ